VGAVHVAQQIVDHVNNNFPKTGNDHAHWTTVEIDPHTTRFIRLAALLHDVGHLPFGHTLEDELHHLKSHDGPDRLERVAGIPFPEHEVDQAVVDPREKPEGGWTLKALIDHLYKPYASAFGGLDPFTVLTHIVAKPPKDETKKKTWDEGARGLEGPMMLRVCQDIVGNTICADFLDYLYRDWYHIGKPMYYDRRLFQYMEVRKPVDLAEAPREPRFVINVGGGERIRHDALTDILELLNARYKLAETVLFHRTKLALTGLLDRCLLEIGDLYRYAKFADAKLIEDAEALLLNASDDGLVSVLEQLSGGGDEISKKRIDEIIAKERIALKDDTKDDSQGVLHEASISSQFETQRKLVADLIGKLRNRQVYTLACKIRMSDFRGHKDPRLQELLRLYAEPRRRLDYLRKMEALCELPPGTLVMNCPPDSSMNAKIAKVNLLIEDRVSPFDEYEETGTLTHGALSAQVKRFYELWAASVYVSRQVWNERLPVEQQHLKSVLKEFLFQMEPGKDPKITRLQMEPSLKVLQARASRSGSQGRRTYRETSFPSGLPFDLPDDK
jgi:HD superfamily phosphohydrolase